MSRYEGPAGHDAARNPMLWSGVFLASLLAGAAPDAVAQGTARFAPAVGTEYEVRVTTLIRTDGRPDVRGVAHSGARVISNDGLVSTKLTRLIGATTDGPMAAAQPTEFSTGNYATTMAFITTEVSASGTGSGVGHSTATRTDCDKGPLLTFLPLGRVQSVTMGCTTVQTLDGVPRSTIRSERTLLYEGPSTVTTPAGTFPVQVVRMTYDLGPESVDARLMIDTQTGLTPRTESLTSAPGRTIQIVGELARVF